MSNTDIIKKLYAAFKSGDFVTFAECCTDDIEWIQNKGFPKGGHHKGVDQIIRNVFGVLADSWNNFTYEIEEYLDAGDTVVVVGYYAGENKTTGIRIKADTVHVFDLVAGKVKRFRQFCDTKSMWDGMPVTLP